MFAALDQCVFSLHRSLNFSPARLERRNWSLKSPYFCLIFTGLDASFHLRIWISQEEVPKFLWAPEGWDKLAFLESVLLSGLHCFFFSSPNKNFCFRVYFLNHSLPNAILFDFHGAAPFRGRWTVSQQACQFLNTSFLAGAILDASSHPVITHLTRVIDMLYFPLSNVSRQLVLFVFLGKSPPVWMPAKSVNYKYMHMSNTPTHTDVINRYRVCICIECSTFHL